MNREIEAWVVGATIGAIVGIATLVAASANSQFTTPFLAIPVGETMIGAFAGWAISALSPLRRKNALGAVVAWASVIGAVFGAMGVLGAIVEGEEAQMLLAIGAGAVAGIGMGVGESYWRFMTK